MTAYKMYHTKDNGNAPCLEIKHGTKWTHIVRVTHTGVRLVKINNTERKYLKDLEIKSSLEDLIDSYKQVGCSLGISKEAIDAMDSLLEAKQKQNTQSESTTTKEGG